MPCAAPCSRLPCNKRCSKTLSCRHQCPGVCGEICPEDYCLTCSGRQDTRVDLLEMKTYNEIDLDETPIVVLGCGHFFTAESLDGHIGMSEVYKQDVTGEFTGLKDISTALALSIPRCPDCQGAVRQYASQRFNRAINRAVIDEMSKRFLVSGKTELQGIEVQMAEMDRILEDSRNDITRSVRQAEAHPTKQLTPAKQDEISQKLKHRNQQCRALEKTIQNFCKKVADKHQPAQKLHNAIINSARRDSTSDLMADLSLANSVPVVERDRRVTFGGRAMALKMESVSLADRFSITELLKSIPSGVSIKISGGAPDQLAKPFFQNCKAFIAECMAESLPKLCVEASLYYATVAQSYRSFGSATNTDVGKKGEYVKTARELLEQACELCDQKFQNAELLRQAVDACIKRLGREWYEKVTPEEMTTIKAAMVGGARGIATHSGHWYNCRNGHPVSHLISSPVFVPSSGRHVSYHHFRWTGLVSEAGLALFYPLRVSFSNGPSSEYYNSSIVF